MYPENSGAFAADDLDIIEESQTVEFVVSESMRLDALVAAECSVTRSAAAKLIEEGAVTVSGKVCAKSLKPKQGEHVCVTLPPLRDCEAVFRIFLLTCFTRTTIFSWSINPVVWWFILPPEIPMARLSMRFCIIAREAFRE